MATADGPDRPPTDREGTSTLVILGSLATIGFEFIAAVLLPGALGWWIDTRLDSAPWLMIMGGVFGFVAGLILMMRAAKQAMKS